MYDDTRANTHDGSQNEVYDAAVVGGGVVGLAVLRELAVLGKHVALVEKEEHLVAGAASSGNSGNLSGHCLYWPTCAARNLICLT